MIDCPATTGSGVWDFVMDRSAEVSTVVPSVAVLFPEIGSVVELDTVAELDRSAVREGFTCTTKCRVVSAAPAATVPSDHVTVPANSVPP